MPGILPSTTVAPTVPPVPQQGNMENPSGPQFYPPSTPVRGVGTGVTLPGAPQPAATPNPMHANQSVNDALLQAFHPAVTDQIVSLLGPAIGQLQGRIPPIAYYQPRQVAMRSS